MDFASPRIHNPENNCAPWVNEVPQVNKSPCGRDSNNTSSLVANKLARPQCVLNNKATQTKLNLLQNFRLFFGT